MLLLVCCSLLGVSGRGQMVGDYYTAGADASRTSVNLHMGDFRSPLSLVRTMGLPGFSDAWTMIVAEDFLLVGERVGDTLTYRLLDLTGDEVTERWSYELEAGALETDFFSVFQGRMFDYVPVYGHGVVILGGGHTVAAVDGLSGDELWRQEDLVGTERRYPLIIGSLAVFHGADRVMVVELRTGEVLWEKQVETAPAPLAAASNRVYVIGRDHQLYAFDLGNGEEVWRQALDSEDLFKVIGMESILTTEEAVYVCTLRDQSSAHVPKTWKLNPADGSIVWMIGGFGSETETLGLILAGGTLIGFEGGLSQSSLYARDSNTGDILWHMLEENHPIFITIPPIGLGSFYPVVINDQLFYYNEATDQIRIRDLFSGKVTGAYVREGASSSSEVRDIRALVPARGRLYLLLKDAVEVYEASHDIYFAHFADGLGQRSLLALTNSTSATVNGTAFFADSQGEPVALSAGIEPAQSVEAGQIEFTIPPKSSRLIQTSGAGELKSGWVRVEADGALNGSLIYQYVDPGSAEVFEAGFGNSKTTGEAIVYEKLQGVFDTGIAIANPHPVEARVELILLDAQDEEEEREEIVIPPLGHRASFVRELFHRVTDIEGTVVIESVLPLVVTALRTRNGLQLSSYPVGAD